MLHSKSCVRNVTLDLFPHAGGAAGGEGKWEEVVGASLWISADSQWIWVDFLHMDLPFLLDLACFGSRHHFLG